MPETGESQVPVVNVVSNGGGPEQPIRPSGRVARRVAGEITGEVPSFDGNEIEDTEYNPKHGLKPEEKTSTEPSDAVVLGEESLEQYDEMVEDGINGEQEVSKPAENLGPQEQLDRKLEEAVGKGQNLVDKVSKVFGLDKLKVTNGERIEVDRSVVEDILTRMANGSMYSNVLVGIEIKRARDDIKIGGESTYMPNLTENIKFLVIETKLDGKKLSGWKKAVGTKGFPYSDTAKGRDVTDRFRETGPVIKYNDKTSSSVSEMMDAYEEFTKSMYEALKLDNDTGGKIRNRTYTDIYHLDGPNPNIVK